MAHLLAHRRHRDTRLEKLRGSTMAELMDGRLDPGATTILLPGLVHHGVVQAEEGFLHSGDRHERRSQRRYDCA